MTQERVLIKNTNLWDGTSDHRKASTYVLIDGNTIETVSSQPIEDAGAVSIDGSGRTLMPGLIDMHSHLAMQEGPEEGKFEFDQMAMGAMTGQFVADYLQQGFTTARDAGGNVLGIAKAINEGRIPGPRIYPSGGFLSQTGGHGDFGNWNDLPGYVDDLERHAFSYVVDGRAEVLRAARQNLRAGATQIKIMGGGGVGSRWDPIHMTQLTLDEMKAAVEIAEDYGTYVLVHAYHDRSVNRAMDAGVRCIEHNFLVSEDTISRMKEEGVALSLQAVMSLEAFANPEDITFFTPDQKKKASQVYEGAKQMMIWAQEHGVLTVTGGDMFSTAFGPRQADNLRVLPSVGFSPLDTLKTATSNAAEVLGWSGEMSPYKEGSLGVIAEGAYADVILVDDNPLDDLDMIDRDHVRVVIKDGTIYKNTLG